jgi:hypothetical protein
MEPDQLTVYQLLKALASCMLALMAFIVIKSWPDKDL